MVESEQNEREGLRESSFRARRLPPNGQQPSPTNMSFTLEELVEALGFSQDPNI